MIAAVANGRAILGAVDHHTANNVMMLTGIKMLIIH
jgi:hypothetical protein